MVWQDEWYIRTARRRSSSNVVYLVHVVCMWHYRERGGVPQQSILPEMYGNDTRHFIGRQKKKTKQNRMCTYSTCNPKYTYIHEMIAKIDEDDIRICCERWPSFIPMDMGRLECFCFTTYKTDWYIAQKHKIVGTVMGRRMGWWIHGLWM